MQRSGVRLPSAPNQKPCQNHLLTRLFLLGSSVFSAMVVLGVRDSKCPACAPADDTKRLDLLELGASSAALLSIGPVTHSASKRLAESWSARASADASISRGHGAIMAFEPSIQPGEQISADISFSNKPVRRLVLTDRAAYWSGSKFLDFVITTERVPLAEVVSVIVRTDLHQGGLIL